MRYFDFYFLLVLNIFRSNYIKCFDTNASAQCLRIFDKMMDRWMNASVYVQHLKLHSIFIFFSLKNFYLLTVCFLMFYIMRLIKIMLNVYYYIQVILIIKSYKSYVKCPYPLYMYTSFKLFHSLEP